MNEYHYYCNKYIIILKILPGLAMAPFGPGVATPMNCMHSVISACAIESHACHMTVSLPCDSQD